MRDIFHAVLLGTAVGDSLGLPAEGLSARKIAKRWRGQWHQRFAFNKGMISDDTEHTVFVAQCLLAHPRDAAELPAQARLETSLVAPLHSGGDRVCDAAFDHQALAGFSTFPQRSLFGR